MIRIDSADSFENLSCICVQRNISVPFHRYIPHILPFINALNVISNTPVVCALQGMRRDPTTGVRTKIYGTDEADVPIQMVLWTPPAVDLRFQEVSYNCTIKYNLS